jgi:hypothetical protein|tara:strand:+ start:403 stop:648 length:246 start_codon:yes stop_codon:yes gene_type:complete
VVRASTPTPIPQVLFFDEDPITIPQRGGNVVGRRRDDDDDDDDFDDAKTGVLFATKGRKNVVVRERLRERERGCGEKRRRW